MRTHDGSLGVDQFVEDVVVEEELLLQANVLERQAVIRVEIGICSSIYCSFAGPGFVHPALHVDHFGVESCFRALELLLFSHLFLNSFVIVVARHLQGSADARALFHDLVVSVPVVVAETKTVEPAVRNIDLQSNWSVPESAQVGRAAPCDLMRN